MSQDAHQEDGVGPTGLDDALATVRDLDEVPTAEHVARFDTVEQRLRARLDDAPDGEAES